MPQNRNKLIDLFIGNISNAITHEILEKSSINEDIKDHYHKEFEVSANIAKNYRQKINPIPSPLPEKDLVFIKNKIINKVNSELQSRINKGYENINLNLVETIVNDILTETNII